MSRVYGFSVGEAPSSAFYMTADGVHVPLHLARVSAWPINRRWPGHQRSIEETELASFALLETDGPTRITLKPNRKFEQVVVKPLSKSILPEIENETISFTLPGPGQYTVELDGYHNALHVFADPVHAYDVDPASDNVIYFGRGIHEAGVIRMTEGQTLFIDEGAVVYGRVEATDAHNIRILGHGILDASRVFTTIFAEMGDEQREAYEKGFAVPNADRQHTIHLQYCDNVEIHGITIRDSLVYNVKPVACRNLHIENVKIIGSWRYNADGIDMHNCEHVRIKGCFVRTFDDSICVKGFDYIQNEDDMFHNGILHDVFTDVLVEDCVIWCDWGRSLEFGAETRAREISNVTFRNCDLIRNTHIALDVQNVDYADIHDVLFENIRVEYDAVNPKPRRQKSDDDVYVPNPNSTFMADLLGSHITYIPEYSAGGLRRGKNRNITFRNIFVTAPAMPPSAFRGYDQEHQSENILIDGLYLNGERITDLEEARISANEFVSGLTLR